MKLLLEGRLGHEREAWWQALTTALPGHDWLDGEVAAPAQRADVDVAVVANPEPGRLGLSPRLRLIQSLWAGVDRLLADDTLPSQVPLARMVDPAMSAAMAETALWAVLSLQRGFFDYQARQQAGIWRQHPQRRADETPVLVLGLGEMGAAAARRIAQQGHPVRGWSRSPRQVPGVDCLHGDAALGPALREAEIVVNLLPLTGATRGCFDASRLAGLRPGASLVNLARGAHVVEADLLAALDAGHLARAVLDVFATEPLPAGHAFWSHPRVTVLPHAAALTDPRSAAAIVATQIEALVQGRTPLHLVERSRGY